jgi:flagellar biosynthesis/type III secretory pathway protein FliH
LTFAKIITHQKHMSKEKKKSGCIGTTVKLLVALFVIGAIATIVIPKSDTPTTTSTPSEPSVPHVKTEEELAAEAKREAEQQEAERAKKASFDEGFRDGFLVGKTDVLEGRPRDGQKAMRLANIHSQSHSGVQASYKSGYHQGYNEGWHQNKR